jgi:hypothetical protein
MTRAAIWESHLDIDAGAGRVSLRHGRVQTGQIDADRRTDTGACLCGLAQQPSLASHIHTVAALCTVLRHVQYSTKQM